MPLRAPAFGLMVSSCVVGWKGISAKVLKPNLDWGSCFENLFVLPCGSSFAFHSSTNFAKLCEAVCGNIKVSLSLNGLPSMYVHKAMQGIGLYHVLFWIGKCLFLNIVENSCWTLISHFPFLSFFPLSFVGVCISLSFLDAWCEVTIFGPYPRGLVWDLYVSS